MKRGYLIILAATLVALVFLAGCTSAPEPEQPTVEIEEPEPVVEEVEEEVVEEVEEEPEPEAEESGSEVVEIDMVARQWEFEPSTITVQEGDTVRLNIKSVDVNHGIGLSAFGVNEKLDVGETVTVEFVADRKGEHSFICNVFCGSGHGGMRGTLIVE